MYGQTDYSNMINYARAMLRNDKSKDLAVSDLQRIIDLGGECCRSLEGYTYRSIIDVAYDAFLIGVATGLSMDK